MGRKGNRHNRVIVIKPVWWRQAGLTLFLLLVAVFFSAIGYVGIVLSWVGTVSCGLVAVLSLLDQLFGWSRLRVDEKGFSLRGWFRRLDLLRDEVEGFELSEYVSRKLIIARLTMAAAEARSLDQDLLPFPCAFGRPVEEVLKQLQKSLRSPY